ncbi:mechanosensitive ion channel family protein [Chitinophaga sp. S165]|uniref:mechanosensitive ion channel family protein n=1 Tax=Chitinophaga sp. S165 TaxID=2135462 RepID=UPI000D70FEAA|nr:mechanosensitive ion channel domain-containing protein [Chitinophaga sp. S165]PWV50433.1 mechanosensitive ion channel-like protein [Chitinophaga sp. S165]
MRNHIFPEIFSTLFLLLLCAHLHAQNKPAPPKPIDSATLSKIISQQVKDTSSGKSVIKLSDTSVAIIITRLETYTLMLNQVMSTLRRGLDTVEISESIPLIDSSMKVVKRDMAASGSTNNVHDLYTNRVLLVQLERKLDSWQDVLFKFHDRLVNITDTLLQLRSDTTMRNFPAEDELRDIYVGQMATLIQKWRQVDSANKANLLHLGLLQNKVAKRYIDVTNLLEDMDFQLSRFTQRMYNKDFSYLWEPPLPGKKGPKFPQVLNRSVHKNINILKIFFSVRGPIYLLWFLGAGLFLWWVSFNAKKVKSKHEEREAETILQQSRYLYRYPVASTILLASTLSFLISIQYPIMFTGICWVITALATTFIIRHNIPPNLFKRWLLLVLLLVMYCINNLLIQVTFTEQWAVFIGGIISILLGSYLLRALRNTTLPLPKYSRSAIWLFIILSALSVVLVVMARVAAAKIVGAASVVSITMALGVVLMVEILMEAVYLQVEAKKDSSTFISMIDYQNIKSRLKTIFYIIAAVGWLALMARNLYLYDGLYEQITDMLIAERKIGNFTFSFSSVIIFLLIIWLSTVVTQIISYLLGYTGQTSQTHKKLGSAMLLIRLAILAAGTLLAFAASGIPMDKLAIVIGALGVGIGFGLQNIVNNLVSGVILAFEKPIEVGDVIELGTRTGVVKEIGIRSSKISAGDGSEVIVPNGDLIAQQLVNWTLTSRTRRVDVLVGIAYGADLKKALTVIKDYLLSQDDILKAPEPVVLLQNFRDIGVDIQAMFWISDLGQAGIVKSQVLTDVYIKLQEAGISIAYPRPQQVQINMEPGMWKQPSAGPTPVTPSAPVTAVKPSPVVPPPGAPPENPRPDNSPNDAGDV